MELLDTPIRVSWEIEESQPGPREALRIADRLTEGGVLLATLVGSPLRHPEAPEILARLARAGTRIEAESVAHPVEVACLRSGLLPDGLLLRADQLVETDDWPGLAKSLDHLRLFGVPVALTFTPRRSALPQIPSLLAFCGRSAVGRLKLPNLRADATLGPRPGDEIPRPEDLRRLALQLEEKSEAGETELEVHDLFLWELLCRNHAGQRSEFGGCQAGRSLAHVTSSGDLLPCSSWPVKLGSLLDETIENLWSGPVVQALRTRTGKTPEGCRGCRIYASCHGGCRGLAETFAGGGEARDPGCDTPR